MEFTLNQVRILDAESKSFAIISGVKQVDGLSPFIFNLVLHYGLRMIRERETLGIPSFQILAYADDIAILGENRQEIEKCLTEMETGTAHLGLEINREKNPVCDSDN